MLAPEASAEEAQQAALREEVERMVHGEQYEAALALCAHTRRSDLMSWVREAYAQFLATHGRFEEAYRQIVQPFQQTEGE